MSGGLDFQPWMVDWRSVSAILFGGAVAVMALYLWLRAGRDRPGDIGLTDDPPMTDYAGIVSSGHQKMPLFLICFIVFASVWGVAYILNAHVSGLRY